MDFISVSKKHSLASSIAHIFLNIILVIACWLSIFVTKMPFLAIILVIISKWRTFAVRPLYWAANFKSNLVDLIFSLGIVILMLSSIDFWLSQAVLLLVYILWLLWLKPQNGENSIKAQALLSIFVGLTAVFSVSYAWPVEVVVALAFIIGYASFRHVLSSDENNNIELLSLFWGMIFAEFIWVLNFLLVGYTIKIDDIFVFIIPQASIIATAISFLTFEALSISRDSKKTARDLIVPTLFTISVCLLLILLFSTIQQK